MKQILPTVICIFLSVQVTNAQVKTERSFSRLSIELDAGMVSSKKHIAGILICDYCHYYSIVLKNNPLAYIGGMVNYQLNRRHQLGLGFAKSEQGYSFNVPFYALRIQKSNYTYGTFRIRHQMLIKQWKVFDILLSNALELDRYIGPKEDYVILNAGDIKKVGLSHMLEIGVGYKFLQRLELTVSAVARTGISKYSKRSYGRDFNRLGYGYLVGLKYWI